MNSPTNPIAYHPFVAHSFEQAVGANIIARLDQVRRERDDATPDFEFPDAEESHSWRCEILRAQFKPREADELRLQVSQREYWKTEYNHYPPTAPVTRRARCGLRGVS